MNHSPKIQLREISKDFPQFRFGAVNLSIASGDTVAVFGPNGAGKSTLFNLMTGNLDPDQGTIEINGQRFMPEHVQARKNIGYLPQNLELPAWVTCLDILSYSCHLHEFQDVQARVRLVAQYWDVEPFLKKPIKSCSYGMQKRVALALAFLHEPDLIILDEPFSGLDILHLRALETALEQRRLKGKTSVISTHVAHFASELCNRAVLVQSGQVRELDQWPMLASAERITLIERQFFPNR